MNQNLEIERIAKLLHDFREEWASDFSRHIARSWEEIPEPLRGVFRSLAVQFLPQETPSTPVRIDVVYPFDVPCRACGVGKGSPCFDFVSHRPMGIFHPSRTQDALDNSKGNIQEKSLKTHSTVHTEKKVAIGHCPVCGKPSDHAVIKALIGGTTEYLCFSPWREGEPPEDVDTALVWKVDEAVVAWRVGNNWRYNDEYTPEPWNLGWSWRPLPPPPTPKEEE